MSKRKEITPEQVEQSAREWAKTQTPPLGEREIASIVFTALLLGENVVFEKEKQP